MSTNRDIHVCGTGWGWMFLKWRKHCVKGVTCFAFRPMAEKGHLAFCDVIGWLTFLVVKLHASQHMFQREVAVKLTSWYFTIYLPWILLITNIQKRLWCYRQLGRYRALVTVILSSVLRTRYCRVLLLGMRELCALMQSNLAISSTYPRISPVYLSLPLALHVRDACVHLPPASITSCRCIILWFTWQFLPGPGGPASLPTRLRLKSAALRLRYSLHFYLEYITV